MALLGAELFRSDAFETLTQCPSCAGTELRSEGRQRDNLFGIPTLWELSGCKRCDLVFVNPRPAQNDLGHAYEVLFPGGADGPSAAAPQQPALALLRLWHWVNGSSSFQARFIPPGAGQTILDVGCGMGALGSALKRRGYKVLGVELNRTQWATAERSGVEVVGQTLFDAELKPDSLDAIVYSHVIEHLPEPGRELEQATKYLRSGGRVYIACPNYKGFQRRLFGAAWHNWHLPFHLTHFSPHSLRHLFEASGLHVISISEESPVHFAMASWRTRSSATPCEAWDDVTRHVGPPWQRAGLGLLLRVLALGLGGDHLVGIAAKP